MHALSLHFVFPRTAKRTAKYTPSLIFNTFAPNRNGQKQGSSRKNGRQTVRKLSAGRLIFV